MMAPSHDAGPADIVGAICGAHAQVMSAAELSIGVRSAGITQRDVQEALWTERSLVKTFGPRGTVHLLPTRDLSMWTGALSTLPASAGNGRSGPALLSPGQIDIVVEAIADALADAELTVDELTEAVVERAGSWAGDPVMEAFQVKWPRWRVTYTNPHRWLPGFRRTDGHPALAELVKRYLVAYGPATAQHFAQWLAAPRRWALELFDSLSGELERVDVDGPPDGCRRATRRRRSPHRPVSGCCPTLTPTRSAFSHANGSFPAGPPSVQWPAVRPATSRCC